jgi:hypothetical protein
MLAIGVAKPDSIAEGTMKRKAPRSPCCWVTAREEIISPTLSDRGGVPAHVEVAGMKRVRANAIRGR